MPYRVVLAGLIISFLGAWCTRSTAQLCEDRREGGGYRFAPYYVFCVYLALFLGFFWGPRPDMQIIPLLGVYGLAAAIALLLSYLMVSRNLRRIYLRPGQEATLPQSFFSGFNSSILILVLIYGVLLFSDNDSVVTMSQTIFW